MRVLNWALDAQKTVGGKIISVILSVVMIFSLSSVFAYSAQAFAEEKIQDETSQAEVIKETIDESSEDLTSVESNPLIEETEKVGKNNSDTTAEQSQNETTDISTNSLNAENIATEAIGINAQTEEAGEVEAAVAGVEFDEATKTLTIHGSDSFDWQAFQGNLDVQGWASAETLIVDNTTLPNKAFSNFKNLKAVTFNNVVAPEQSKSLYDAGSDNGFTLSINGGKIEKYAFMSSKIISVDIKNCSVGERAFQSCSKLSSATFENVEKIDTYAFQRCGFTSLDLNGINSIGNGAFSYNNNLTHVNINNVRFLDKHLFYQSQKLASATVTNCDEIGYCAFRDCPALEKVNINNVKKVGWLAFLKCPKLFEVSLSSVSLIEGGAFEGCDGLTKIDIDANTQLGYLDADRNLTEIIPGITDRVEAILKGSFALDSAPGIVELGVDEGWTDSKIGKSDNWNDYNTGTQIVEQARWTNDEATEAEVKVDAYFTAEKQMDYIFVVDMSNSMTLLGNSSDKNARFYDMQSKLYDVSNRLLNSEGYDCRVAFVTFGEKSSKTFGFYSDKDQAHAAISSLTPYYENTNYGLGLDGAKALIKTQDSDRDTTVVFISDGQPRGTADDVNGAISSEAIKELNVPIYGVLQSVPEDELEGATAAMKDICSDGLFFKSKDTDSFSKAVNKAIAAKYPTQTITIPINEAFENVQNINVSVSSGEAVLSEDEKSIIWTITGMPFTKHTLTYNMSLTEENAASSGTFSVNAGNASIEGGAFVESPQLSRTVTTIDPTPTPDPEPTPTPDPTPTPTPNPGDGGATTPAAPAATPAATPAAAPAPAAPAAAPAAPAVVIPDEENPLAAPEQEIADDENPLAAFDHEECWVHWFMIAGIILTIIYGAVVVLRRTRNTKHIDKMEKDLIGTTDESTVTVGGAHHSHA